MTIENLVIIDWFSPAAHENFNRSFIEAISGSFKRMYVFEKYRSIEGSRVVELPRPRSRWQNAIKVRDLVARVHANDPVLLLSYDAKYIPLLWPHYRRLLAYEHNTTPEVGSKQALWQWVCTRSLRRLAQFPQQEERLSNLKQSVRYVGSPLSQLTPRLDARPLNPPVFLLPSVRSDTAALIPFLGFFEGATLVCKAADEDFVKLARNAGVKIDLRARLEFRENGVMVNGVIVSVPSSIRGSGWVNDAIGYGVPVIATTEASTNIIKRTFPDLEFVELATIAHKEAFCTALNGARQQEFPVQIRANNRAFRYGLEEELSMLSW